MTDEMQARKSGSERFLEVIDSNTPKVLANLVHRRLAEPASLRDIIDVVYEQVEINTKLAAVLVSMLGQDRDDKLEKTRLFVSSLSEQTKTLGVLYDRVAIDIAQIAGKSDE